jgi:hypothetical protein
MSGWWNSLFAEDVVARGSTVVTGRLQKVKASHFSKNSIGLTKTATRSRLSGVVASTGLTAFT